MQPNLLLFSANLAARHSKQMPVDWTAEAQEAYKLLVECGRDLTNTPSPRASPTIEQLVTTLQVSAQHPWHVCTFPEADHRHREEATAAGGVGVADSAQTRHAAACKTSRNHHHRSHCRPRRRRRCRQDRGRDELLAAEARAPHRDKAVDDEGLRRGADCPRFFLVARRSH